MKKYTAIVQITFPSTLHSYANTLHLDANTCAEAHTVAIDRILKNAESCSEKATRDDVKVNAIFDGHLYESKH
jgi:hypothetical protein